MKKSKKFVLAGLVLLAITMVLLPLTGCKNDSVSEAHNHTFNEDRWEKDATGHWHPATCGHTGEKGGFASHTFGDWKVETESTDIAAGKLVKKCTTCSWTDEMEIPAGFVYIPAGTFQMGSTAGYPDELPVHGVTISKGYFMGRHEVTQKEYEKYCSYTGGEDKKPMVQYGVGGDYPAYYVSWYDAGVYCNRRSIAERLTPCYAIDGETDPSKWGDGTVPTSNDSKWNGVTCNSEANGYRLPTEAEWEYAARAGDDTTNARTWSGTKTDADLGKYAWFNGRNGTSKVGTLAPNEWGLHDMSGNVWEWCWDWDGDYSTESVTNPTGPTGGSSVDGRVIRGGSWIDYASGCTVSKRIYNVPYDRNDGLGFRLVRSAN